MITFMSSKKIPTLNSLSIRVLSAAETNNAFLGYEEQYASKLKNTALVCS